MALTERETAPPRRVAWTPETLDGLGRALAGRYPKAARAARVRAHALRNPDDSRAQTRQREERARLEHRLAVRRVHVAPLSAAAIASVARPRERRDGARSSARSGDSGADDGGEEPPWLEGHGDVETQATTWRPPWHVRLRDALRPGLRRL